MFKYLYCHRCQLGHLPEDWKLADGSQDADHASYADSVRARACPNGHRFEHPESWQTERQYQQDREHERQLAAYAAATGPPGSR